MSKDRELNQLQTQNKNKMTETESIHPQASAISPPLDVASLEKLQEEVILLIFSKLPFRDILKFSSASKRLHRIAQDNDLWQLKFSEAFRNKYIEIMQLPGIVDWQKQFKIEYEKQYGFTFAAIQEEKQFTAPPQSAKASKSWAIALMSFLSGTSMAKQKDIIPSSASGTFLQDLPDIAIMNIIEFLTPQEISKFALVHPRFSNLIQKVGRDQFKQYYPGLMEAYKLELKTLEKTLEDINLRLSSLNEASMKDVSEMKKLEQSKENLENSIFNFWQQKFARRYTWLVPKNSPSNLKELLHQIMLGNVDGVKVFLQDNSVWISFNKIHRLRPLLFLFLQTVATSNIANRQAILNCFYENRPKKSNFSDWVWAVICAQPIEEIKAATNNNLNILDNHGYSPLHYATFVSNATVVQDLIKEGALVDVRSSSSLMAAMYEGFWSLRNNLYTPLHLAALYGDVESVRNLLLNNAHHYRAADGTTPLLLATKAPCVEIVEMLLRSTDDSKSFINDVFHPTGEVLFKMEDNLFHTACKKGWIKLIKLLIEFGADVNRKNQCKEQGFENLCRTPLFIIIRVENRRTENSGELLELLLQHGADPSLKCHTLEEGQIFGRERTAFDLAILLNDVTAAQSLVKERGFAYRIVYTPSILSPNKAELIIREAFRRQELNDVVRDSPASAQEKTIQLLKWYATNKIFSIGIFSSTPNPKKLIARLITSLENLSANEFIKKNFDEMVKAANILKPVINKDEYLSIIIEMTYSFMQPKSASPASHHRYL